MSQPSQRSGCCKAPGTVDESLGEFWTENPWNIVKEGHNLSAYERHRTWLNIRGKQFLDVSFLSGMDNDGDGRAAVAADFHNNGRLDVAVRNVGGNQKEGGGGFLLYENHFPQRHFLEVTLRGTKSNRLGIGARLTAEAGDLRQVREMYPANSFRSQAPCVAHFGLGGADRVRLTIRWPSGDVQVLDDLPADRHIVVTEGAQGAAAVEAVVPGQTIRP